MSDDDEPDQQYISYKDHPDYERPEEWSDTLQVVNVANLAAAIANSSATRGIDWYMTQRLGISTKDWAFVTDRSKQTVDRNVKQMIEENGDRPSFNDAHQNPFEIMMFDADPVIGYESDNEGDEE